MRILFPGSAGGHLAQLLGLKSWYRNHQRLWVTFDLPDARLALAGEKTIWLGHTDRREIAGLAASVRALWRIIGRSRPDIVITTGASLGALAVVIGRLRRIPTIYIEVFDRIDNPSLSGRICYRVADRFCVQFPAQLAIYPRAEVIGALL